MNVKIRHLEPAPWDGHQSILQILKSNRSHKNFAAKNALKSKHIKVFIINKVTLNLVTTSSQQHIRNPVLEIYHGQVISVTRRHFFPFGQSVKTGLYTPRAWFKSQLRFLFTEVSNVHKKKQRRRIAAPAGWGGKLIHLRNKRIWECWNISGRYSWNVQDVGDKLEKH